MSADIYTKSFSSPQAWVHDLEFINIVDKNWIDDSRNISDWINTRKGLGDQVIFDDPVARSKWSKASKRKA